jgi:hypothetical protein
MDLAFHVSFAHDACDRLGIFEDPIWRNCAGLTPGRYHARSETGARACHEPLSGAHRVSDGGNDRDAVSAGRGPPRGTGIYPELRGRRLAKDRIVEPAEVRRRDPELVIASWCGKATRKATITSRPGWQDVAAVRAGHVYEIKSTYILQPGPASLTEGVRRLHTILARVVGADSAVPLSP